MLRLWRWKIGLISKIADIYISKPFGYKYQNNFYNTAVLLKTNKAPLELINKIHQIEKKLKKNKRITNGPRNIDIDIIFYGKNKYYFNNLIIPHPRAVDRDFVLFPVLDIDPFFDGFNLSSYMFRSLDINFFNW